jgi:hypothetical protein
MSLDLSRSEYNTTVTWRSFFRIFSVKILSKLFPILHIFGLGLKCHFGLNLWILSHYTGLGVGWILLKRPPIASQTTQCNGRESRDSGQSDILGLIQKYAVLEKV